MCYFVRLQFVSVAGFFVNLIGILSFRHNHSHHHHHSHGAPAATHSHGGAGHHCHASSHSHGAACPPHGHAGEHSHSTLPTSSPAVTHNTNMEGPSCRGKSPPTRCDIEITSSAWFPALRCRFRKNRVRTCRSVNAVAVCRCRGL